MRLLALILAAPLILPLVLLGCGAETDAHPAGLVIQNNAPADPSRPYFFDMGVLEYGTRHDLAIYFVNHDSVPVTILEVDPACQCTAAKRLSLVNHLGEVILEGDVERRGNMLTVPPGARAELVIGVNTRSVLPNREKLAVMRIKTDSVTKPFLTLEVHLATHRPFVVTPASIQLGAIPQGYGGSARVEIMTGVRGGQGFVTGVSSASGGLEANLAHLFINNEHIWTLTATVPPMKPKGALKEKILLDTLDDLGQEGTLSVDVWGQVVDDVGFDRTSPHFGVLARGESRTLALDLVARVPGLRVRLEDVRITGQPAGNLTVSWGPKDGSYVDDDGRCNRWTLQIVAAGGLPKGRFEAELVALIDDDQFPIVRTQIRGMVR